MARRFFSRILVMLAVLFVMPMSAFADNQIERAETHINNMMQDLQGLSG
jgi:hypothetical protein